MAQKVVGYIKLQIPAGKATPAPPVGPALGQHGVNIMAFTKEFNERTKNDAGMIIPVIITVYADRSFSFITKTPPAPVLIKKACGIESGSAVPAGAGPHQEGLRHRIRFGCTEQDQGRQAFQGGLPEDRGHLDARPDRRFPGSRDEHDRGYRALDGHYRRGII